MAKITKNEQSKYLTPSLTRKFDSAEAEESWAKTQTKVCTKCHECKTLNEYGFNTSGRDAFDKSGYRLRRPECEVCNKKVADGKREAKKRAKSLGLTTKAPVGTTCKLCKTSEGTMCFDHDHKTNTFRGWLCDPCNRSIGVLSGRVTNGFKSEGIELSEAEALLKVVEYLGMDKNQIISYLMSKVAE